MKSSRRLLYLAFSDLSRSPYPEMVLPVLASAGWEITAVAKSATQSLLNSVLPYPATRLDLPQGARSADISAVQHLLAGRMTRYDVIYVVSQSAAVRAWPALWRAPRVVYHNLDYFDPLTYPVQCWFERKIARTAALHINAEVHRALIVRAQYKLRCPILVLPPSLPTAWPVPAREHVLRQQLEAGADAFVLSLHGGYSELRMTNELFLALALLPNRFRLVMSHSGGSQGMVRDRLVQLGILDRVTFRPDAEFQHMLAYSVNCDAGILLYKNTDAGNYFQAPGRLTEYLACGLPVLTNNFVGLEHLCLKYGIGETVDARMPTDIAQGILRLERLTRETRSQHFRNQFLRYLAADHWSASIRDAFEQVFEGRSVETGDNISYPWWSSHERRSTAGVDR